MVKKENVKKYKKNRFEKIHKNGQKKRKCEKYKKKWSKNVESGI